VLVERYSPGEEDAWDALVEEAPMGTFLHSRRFLSYHGDRFTDVSVTLRDDRGRTLGVLPAAVDPGDEAFVTSHPGATFGGIVHSGGLLGARMEEALEATARHFREAGFRALRYKPVPSVYHRGPSDDDLFALFRIGASRTGCDLSCAVDLAHRRPPNSRRRRALKKAQKAGTTVERGPTSLPEFWPVLQENLETRHGVSPVHTLAEMSELIDRFPDQITVVVGRLEGEVVAGVVLFQYGIVSHAQYIASSAAGMDVNALDAVFDECIRAADASGLRAFDFGISNHRDPDHTLNTGLYDFKTGFGGGGVAHEIYDVALGSNAAD
jgi:hypothetical protein